MSNQIKSICKHALFYMIERCTGFLNRDHVRPDDIKVLNNILVFEGGGIGDFFRIFPVIKILHDNFPKASISLVISPGAAGLLELFPNAELFHQIFYYDAHGEHKALAKKMSLLLMLRKKKFDMIYAASKGEGMRERDIMMYIINAPIRVGFTKDNVGNFFTIKKEFDYRLPILRQNLQLLEESGLNMTRDKIELFIPEQDRDFAARVLEKVNAPVITINPDASWKAHLRSWPLEKYISLIQKIVSDINCYVIVLGDKTLKENTVKAFEKLDSSKVINMSGLTTIAEAAALIERSDLFIGNDSGPLHVARVLQRPSIGIFGSTLPEQVIGHSESCFVVRKDLSCSPCYVHQYDFDAGCDDVRCLNEVQVSDVMEALSKTIHFTNMP